MRLVDWQPNPKLLTLSRSRLYNMGMSQVYPRNKSISPSKFSTRSDLRQLHLYQFRALGHIYKPCTHPLLTHHATYNLFCRWRDRHSQHNSSKAPFLLYIPRRPHRYPPTNQFNQCLQCHYNGHTRETPLSRESAENEAHTNQAPVIHPKFNQTKVNHCHALC